MHRRTILIVTLCALLLVWGCARKEAAQPAPETSPALSAAPAATAAPTAEPTAQPTAQPTAEPTPAPTPLVTYVFTGGEEDWAELSKLLAENPTLKQLDLTESGVDIRAHARDLAALEELWFKTELCGAEVTEATAEFCPLTPMDEGDMAALDLVRGLTTIDLRTAGYAPADVQAVQARFPQAEVLWQYDLCGVEVGPDTTELNFNDQPIASLDPFYEVLPLLTKLTSLEMCGCGVGNEDMDALRTAFPQAGIVWSIKTRYWTVRTDTDHFATWRIARMDAEGKILEAYNIHGNSDEELSFLQYCHDIVALDVGHNKLTNCEFVRNMPKLKYLILADNKISDLSPLSDLKELIYLEIFVTRVTDLSPLSTVESLLDINLCDCHVTDLSPLYSLKKLERVWVTPYDLKDPRGAAAAFHEALPDCKLQYISGTDSTGMDWRYHERYREMRLALGRAKP